MLYSFSNSAVILSNESWLGMRQKYHAHLAAATGDMAWRVFSAGQGASLVCLALFQWCAILQVRLDSSFGISI